jgi:hypothetical protein
VPDLPNQLKNLAFFLVIYVLVPCALARGLVGATWPQIGVAYAILYGTLFVLLGAWRGGDAFGWVFILGLFFTIPGISLISLALKIFRIAA